MIKRKNQIQPLKRTALRKARQRIAAGSLPFGSRDLSSTRTRVLPLADAVSDAVWAIARDAALTLRGFGQGSLADLLMGLHAAGWRLFGSGSERDGFLLASMFDQAAFDAAAARDVGAVLPKLTAANLRAVLAASPRKVGPDTDAGLLTERLARAFGVKASQLDTPPALVGALATALTEAFPSWRELTAVDAGVGKVVDDVITAAGHKWPSLQAGWAAQLPEAPKGLGVPTLAFDSAAIAVEEATPSARFAGIVARYLPEAGGLTEPGVAKGVQARITTVNGNGLSWLFGVGRRALQQLPRDEVIAGLGVKGERATAALDAVVAGLSALPDLAVLGDRAYPDARSSLQGAVDSLIANYINRLVELHTSVSVLDDVSVADLPLLGDEGAEWRADLFDGMPFAPDDVADMLRARPEEMAKLQAALDVLAGVTPAGAGDFDRAILAVEAFGGWAARTESVAAQINARIKTIKAPATLRMKGVLNGGRWKALVSLTPPEGPPAEMIPELDGRLRMVLNEASKAFDTLVAAYQPTMNTALDHTRRDVRSSLRMRAGDSTTQLSEEAIELLARRKLLDHVARVVRRSSSAMAQAFLAACAVQGLTRAGSATERSLRGHILSGEQALYAHPFARRQSVVRLERDGLLRMDLDALLGDLERDAAARQDVRERVMLQFVRESLLLMGLPERVRKEDTGWAAPAVPADSPWAGASRAPWVDLRASADGTVARSEVIKAYTTRFHSVASGLLYRLNRVRFLERYDVRCFVGSTLLFVPTDAAWTPPEQYRHGKYAHWINHPELPRTPEGAINVRPAAKWLSKASADVAPELRQAAISLLSQFPHEWVVACDFEGAEIHEGVFASDGDISGWVKRRGYRMNVPRHFAGELLAGFKGASISPHGLTFEREMEREGTQVRELSRRVTSAFPIGLAITPDERRWAPRHVVGLDLGEAGLGVCLRHLESGAETQMLLPVRKTRLLARQQEHYRRKVQPRQAFRKSYSDSTEIAIKAAIGEVCGLIDNLIARYDAVPVFESSVAHARGSNKMVQRVFAGVVQRYTFIANNGAAQTLRQGHWFGAGRWQFPFGADVLPAARALSGKQLDKAKVEAVFRPAQGYPGVMASGYRTSLICACCGEDVLSTLDAAVAHGQTTFSTDADGRGVLQVPGREVRLQLEAPSPNPITQKAARRRKRRAPWEVLANRTWTLTRTADRADLASVLRRGLRRPTASIQGNTTSGWEFHCPACGALAQADVNAATNLVRRYQERVVWAGQVMTNWDDAEVRKAFIQSLMDRKGASEHAEQEEIA